MGILTAAGCGLGYQQTPYPPCFLPDDPDPACQSGQGAEGSGTAASVPTTGTPFSGSEDSSSGEDDSTGPVSESGTESGEIDTGATAVSNGGESTGPEAQPEPEILDMSLSPDAPKSAGPVTVTVQTENAMEVWMAVDSGDAVELDPVGDEGTEFVGEIAVLGESWNGLHTVSAVARAGELESPPSEEMFTVSAPPAGSEVWKKKSALTPSYGNAVAVDAEGGVYELLTVTANATARCHVRRRSAAGVPVWPQDTVQLTADVYCFGEDIKVAPDGTLWVLVNTLTVNILRWQIFHLDADGALIDEMPEVSDLNETGRGLDVNSEGEILLCGERPAVQGIDAWVRLRPPVGDSWTVPWIYTYDNKDFDERTKDCAFVEDRIVVVGEVYGKHENIPGLLSRGFVAEYGQNGVKFENAVASAEPAQQSGYHAVTPDGNGGYVVGGYTCDMAMVPCTPTTGALRRFTLGASMGWEQPNGAAVMVWDIARSPAGYVVVAAQAHADKQGFLVQGWSLDQGMPMWSYQGTPSDLQVATGIALSPFAAVFVGGFYLENGIQAAGVVKLHP